MNVSSYHLKLHIHQIGSKITSRDLKETFTSNLLHVLYYFWISQKFISLPLEELNSLVTMTFDLVDCDLKMLQESNCQLPTLPFSLWNVSHPAGCPGYVKPADPTVNGTATTFCKDLALEKVLLPTPSPSSIDSF